MQQIDGSRPGARELVPAQVHMGRLARRALGAGHGSVLAGFGSAVYIESAAGIACLVPPSAPRGPLNVVLPAFKPATPELPGAAWRTDGTRLAIDRFGAFAISPHEEWTPARPISTCPTALVAGLASMGTALAARAMRGDLIVHALASLRGRLSVPAAGVVSRPGPFDARLARSIPALSRWLDDALTGRGASIPGPVADLLGTGRGLTPAGDDCIVGVLVALGVLGERRVAASVADVVARHAAQRTSRLSAAHLAAACAGEAIEPVHAAIAAIAGNGSPGPVLDALEGFGRGSGFDALAGVLLVADAIARHRASAGRSASAYTPVRHEPSDNGRSRPGDDPDPAEPEPGARREPGVGATGSVKLERPHLTRLDGVNPK